MELLSHFTLSLIAAGFPWLAGAIVIAHALRKVGPIDIRLRIGRRSGKRGG